MSTRLRVEELRADLHGRGLDASGNKTALERRLDAAIRMEEKDVAAAAAAATTVADGDSSAAVDGDRNGGNKRKRRRTGDGEEEGNGDPSQEAAKLETLGYRELQGLAKARGLAANGGKKELLERLLSAPVNAAAAVDGGVQDNMKVIAGGDERIEEVGKEKMVTATKKGAAVLDQHIPDHIKMTYHVLQVNLMLMEPLWFTIDGVELGHEAKISFMGPLQHETKQYMNLRGSFRAKLRTFGLIARNSNVMKRNILGLKWTMNNIKSKGSSTDQIKETKLETLIAQFISLICNITMMKQQMVEIEDLQCYFKGRQETA